MLAADKFITKEPDAKDATEVSNAARIAIGIKQTLPTDIYATIQGKGTPKVIFEALKERFDQSTIAIVAHTKKRLYGMRCSESGDVLRFIDKIIKIKGELANLGRTIQEEEYVSILTQALPKSYQTIISNASTTHDMMVAASVGGFTGKITSDKLLGLIRAEALTRNEIHRGSFRKHHAHVAENTEEVEADDSESSDDAEEDTANAARYKGRKPFKGKGKKSF